ncbi:acyl-CoA thioester hydrolase YbgC [Salmonella enterica subsp. enterica]|uniref:Acyl-CoA thioester hydrolase YbgC n=1 Tax=Salmonella enterica I TaxID=59201 RepID=A0A447MVR7_SALET|nr:acyl-CoA thioester hydrolase YbgC [Salmonella enterica subsp. enterica]
MPGKPAWYMFDNCQSKHAATIGVMCSAAFWSQNNGLQLQNLTIENTLGDSVDAGNHPAVALRTDGDKVQINKVNILGRQNTFFVTNSGVQNRLQPIAQPRTLVTNSYIEGDVDMVSGRGAVVFDNTKLPGRQLPHTAGSLRLRPGDAVQYLLWLFGDQQPL